MKFSVIGNKAFRDPHDANAEFAKVAQETGKIPAMAVVEFDTTARVNEFYRVSRLASGENGGLVVTSQSFVRTAEEVITSSGESGVISYEKVAVFPYIAPVERPGRRGNKASADDAAQAPAAPTDAAPAAG